MDSSDMEGERSVYQLGLFSMELAKSRLSKSSEQIKTAKSSRLLRSTALLRADTSPTGKNATLVCGSETIIHINVLFSNITLTSSAHLGNFVARHLRCCRSHPKQL